MCRFREMTRRLFLSRKTGALGVQRDVFEALYHTCHNSFSQQRTVSRLETDVPSRRSGFKRTQVVLLGAHP